jgi:steroid delta-isomerase-like uncharacterized protein
MTTGTQLQREARLRAVEEHLDAENNHDIGAIMATFSPQPAFALNGAEFGGAETVRALYEGFGFGEGGSFSGLRVEVLKLHPGDESATAELMLRGRHTGDWQGVPATGREVAVPVCAVFTFDAQDRVASERVYFDGALVLRQLGVLA